MVSVLSMLSSKALTKITISKLMKKKLSNLILEQLINGHLDYVNFQAVHKGDENEDAPKCISNMSDSDELVTEALDFFENRSYTDPVVDLLVQVTC